MMKQKTSSVSSFIIATMIGAVLGFVGGHIVWFIFGQIQLIIGISFPYAAFLGPPIYYQIGWVIFGVLAMLKKGKN